MLKLVAVCGFLTIALSFDFGGMDEATYESALRDQGFSEEDIQTFLQVYYVPSSLSYFDATQSRIPIKYKD